jgi:hypothetical protein
LIGRRLDDAVDGRFVVSSREELECIADVDDKGVWDVFDPTPFAVRGEDLEGGDALRPEDAYSAVICVSFEPDVLGLLFLSLSSRIAVT